MELGDHDDGDEEREVSHSSARVVPTTTVESDWKTSQERPWIVVDARLLRQNGFSVYDMKSLMAFRRDFKLMLF